MEWFSASQIDCYVPLQKQLIPTQKGTRLIMHSRLPIKQYLCLALLLSCYLPYALPTHLLAAPPLNTSSVSTEEIQLETLKGPLITVPAGTSFTVSLQQPVSTQINKVGDTVEALVETPLIAESRVVLPKGSLIQGTIVGVRSSGGAVKSGSLELRFTKALPTGTKLQLPLLAKVKTPNGSGVLEGEGFKSNVGQIATKTAIGAATGAATGSISGLLRHSNVGNGAIIGASIGAGVFLIYSLLQTKPQPVELENQAPLTLVLEQALTVGGGNNNIPIQVVLPPYTPKSNPVEPATTKQSLPETPAEKGGYYGY
jgi:hypothetical protein